MVLPPLEQSDLNHQLRHPVLNDKAQLASPLYRWAAFVVDYYILCLPFILVLMSPFKKWIQESLLINDYHALFLSAAGLFFVLFVFIFFYQVFFFKRYRATPGFMIFGLELINLWHPHQGLPLSRLILRYVGWSSSFLIAGLPFFSVFTDHKRRPFYDRFNDFVVVSKKVKSQASEPLIFEKSIASVLQIFVLIFFIGLMLHPIQNINSLQAFGSAESTQSCEAVTKAYEEWPSESDQYPSRLSVAMALYAAERIEKKCLELEARHPFLDDSEKALQHLAFSFVYSEQQELSDLYLENVCSFDSDSEACLMSQVIDKLSQREWEKSDVLLQELSRGEKLFSQIWSLRHWARTDRYEEAFEILEKLPSLSTLGPFILPLRVQILWGLKKRDEARLVASVGLDLLPPSDQLDLSQWLCFEELSYQCDQLTAKSCRIFSDSLQAQPDINLDFYPALTSLKITQCQATAGDSFELQTLLKNPLHAEVRALALIIQKNDLRNLKKIIRKEEPFRDVSSGLVEQASLLLFELKPTNEDVRFLTELWSKQTFSPRWEEMGLKLFDYWRAKKEWAESLQVAQRLVLQSPLMDQDFLQEYTVALYRAGFATEAEELLSALESGPSSSRQPASLSDYNDLVEELQLKRSKKEKAKEP